MPPLIFELLNHPATFVVARIVLTTLFWSEVILGLTNFSAFVEAMKRVSLPLPKYFAILTILVQLVGSFLLITNVNNWGWFGAGMLGVFTLLTIPYGHAFWKFPQPRRTQELHFVLEHITVVGGLLLAAVLLTKG